MVSPNNASPLVQQQQDLHLVLVAFPGYGHIRPMRALAREYTARGYPITVITSSTCKAAFNAIDPAIRFVPLQGAADFDIDKLDELFPERANHAGPAQALFDLEHIFIAPMAAQFDVVQSVLQSPELADKKVVMLADPVFLGNLPMLLGSTKARRVPVVAIGHMPLMIMSKDTAPFGPGIPSQGVEKNMAMNQGAIQMFAPIDALLRKRLEPYDCQKALPETSMIDNVMRLPDIYCQLCPPELELPRSDLPPSIRFCGSLQGGNVHKPAPSWFQSFIHDSTSPLILVTSGTVSSVNPHDLIIPTLTACSSLPIRLIVCAVHASLPSDLTLPPNARIAEWIAFEDVFPYTSLMITNGGYGGICQALGAGIPMIVSGTTEDKTESTLRAESTGAAINLRAQRVTPEQIGKAIEQVLENGKYKEKAMEIQAANKRCNALESILEAAKELKGKFYGE